jgi:hypothetical protein
VLQLREFLHKSLYDPERGYFTANTANVPVGTIGRSLDFKGLLGETDYLTAIKRHYTTLQVPVLPDACVTVIVHAAEMRDSRGCPDVMADSERDIHAFLWPSHGEFHPG